jgi:hypothetical protein
MEMSEFSFSQYPYLILLTSFFLIAMMYASVGFGGGSSYLAILALFAISFTTIRTTALLCNVIVVAAGTYIFYKEGHLNFRKAFPLVISSIPMAYVGGLWPIQQKTFFILLSGSLILVAFFLWIQPGKKTSEPAVQSSLAINVFIGAGLGLLSGLVGIGGGIFLSPLLHFMRWDDAKKISAMASFFILVNSISGLAGQWQQNPTLDWSFVAPLLIAVFFGGQIGSRVGARRFNQNHVKKITAVLIFIAGSKILLDTL